MDMEICGIMYARDMYRCQMLTNILIFANLWVLQG